MSNHLDLIFQNSDSGTRADHSFAAPGNQQASTKTPPAPVKAGFAYAPIEVAADITGRWRPVWTRDSADLNS